MNAPVQVRGGFRPPQQTSGCSRGHIALTCDDGPKPRPDLRRCLTALPDRPRTFTNVLRTLCGLRGLVLSPIHPIFSVRLRIFGRRAEDAKKAAPATGISGDQGLGNQPDWRSEP